MNDRNWTLIMVLLGLCALLLLVCHFVYSMGGA